MANEELGLRLTAQITEWLANLTKAGAAADGLKTTVLELEQAVKRAFAGIEAISRQSGGKMVGAFVGAAREMDKATDAIEADAKRTVTALGTIGKAAIATDKAVNSAAGGIASGTKKIGQAADDAGRNTAAGLTGVEAAVGKVGERIKGSILNIQNALLGLGALRFGQAAVGAASDFEAALGQLAIVASDTGVPIAQLRQQLLDLSKTTPLALGDLTKAYATAVGSLPKGANQAKVAFEALNAAQQAARASGASTEETLRGITALLNTYGDEGLTAAQITDKLFATFDQGAATVPELSASIGQVAGIAKGFGITIDEVFGSIAVLTRGGQTGSEAITNLRQALISTANGGSMDKVATQLKELGLSAELFSAQSLRKNGLIGVLEQVEAAGGKPVLNKLFTDTQGLLAVQTLLSKGLRQTRDDIERIGDSAGKTDAAVALIGQNFDQLAGIAKNRLGAALIQIGDKILPTVVRVLNDLAGFAEANGAQIADGIGKAVSALASFGAWVVEYGPTVLAWFVAFKGLTFFSGLERDVLAAVGSLTKFTKELAASQAIGQGMAALGGTAGTSFNNGFIGKLKGLGGMMRAVLGSGTFIGVVAGAGFLIGSELIDGISDVVTRDLDKLAGEIKTRTDELGDQIADRLQKIGFASIEEMDRALASGTKVIVDGTATTLTEAAAKGVDALENAAAAGFQTLDKLQLVAADRLNAARLGLEDTRTALEALEAQVQTKLAAAGTGPGSDIAAVAITRGAEPAILAAQAKQAEAQAILNSVTKDANGIAAGRNKLQAEYNGLVKKTEAGAGGSEPSGIKGAGKKLVDDSRDVVNALIAEYEAGYNKLRELQLQGLQLSAEAAQNEADARRQAYEDETDARVAALENADVAEKAVAELRTERERGLVTLLEAQIGAAQKVANARIEQAKYAAEKETEAFRENADVQAAIAANLKTEKTTIEAELAARTEEIRSASGRRITAAEREEDRARVANAIRLQEEAAARNRRNSAGARLQAFAGGPTAEGVAGGLAAFGAAAGGEGAGAAGIIGGGAATGTAAAIGGLPLISQGLEQLGNLFGGDVEGLTNRAKAKEDEAAKIEKQIAAIDKAEVTRKQQSAKTQEQADALRNRADELSAKAREDGISKEEKKRLSDASAALRAQAAKITRGVEGSDAARAAEKQALAERLAALQAESKELRDRADAARGGLETFFDDLATNLEKALTGFIVGLPQAIDRILTVAIPGLIEGIIANLPALFGAAISLLPRIVISLARAIAFGLPGAIRDGWAAAGKALFEFFTTGVVAAIASGIADAFTAAGAALVDAIVAVFRPIIEFFKNVGEETGNFFGDLFGGDGNGAGAFIGRTAGTSALGKILTGKFSDLGVEDVPLIGGIAGLFHQGGTVDGGASNPHMAAALASAGAQRFASGGMVAGLNSLARRRMSQLLNGDDVPAILAPGEGVLTAQGVNAVGGPVGVDSINRGNPPGGAAMGAQVMISARLGGDRALAALISRMVSVSVLSPAGNVRAALDQSGIATSVPAYAGLR